MFTHATIIVPIFRMKIRTPVLSLTPSSSIAKIQTNFKGLAASLGTGDARATFLRAVQAKEGWELVTPPSCPPSPKATQTLISYRGRGCVSAACCRQHCWFWHSGLPAHNHVLSQWQDPLSESDSHAEEQQLSKHLSYQQLIGIRSVGRQSCLFATHVVLTIKRSSKHENQPNSSARPVVWRCCPAPFPYAASQHACSCPSSPENYSLQMGFPAMVRSSFMSPVLAYELLKAKDFFSFGEGFGLNFF